MNNADKELRAKWQHLTRMLADDFLREHKDATEIVVDTTTNLPVRAVYTYDRIHGGERKFPATFYFFPPSDDEIPPY